MNRRDIRISVVFLYKKRFKSPVNIISFTIKTVGNKPKPAVFIKISQKIFKAYIQTKFLYLFS